MSKRKLVYYVAVTLDNFIAREDESVEGFLTEGHYISDYLNELKKFDTVLMGKATYEWGYQWGVKAGEPSPTYSHMMQYVFSGTMAAYQHPQLEVIREDAALFVQDLKTQTGRDIYLCGGGKLAGSLLEAELIDELILKLNPIRFGKGIPLFGQSRKEVKLDLLDSKSYNNGLLSLHYAIRY